METPDVNTEMTNLNIDDKLIHVYDCQRDDAETWNLVEKAQNEEVLNHVEECDYKYNLPGPKEFHSFSKNIYANSKKSQVSDKDFGSLWRLLYRVQGKVFFKLFDGFYAELYFNTQNNYLLLAIKGTSSVGNVWSDIKNVGLQYKGGELDSAFTFGEKVRVLMNKFKCKPMLLITGHSLGGYLAQIITYTVTYCFVDGDGKVRSRKEPMDDFGIYTMVFDSPAALKQIMSIDLRDPIQFERFRLPIVNMVVDVNIVNSNSKVGPHLGQVVAVKEFDDLKAPNKWQRIYNVKSAHKIKSFEEIDIKDCLQVEYLPGKKTVSYEEKEIQSTFLSAINFERLQKYLFLATMCAEWADRLPKFKIFNSCIFLEADNISAEEFIPRAHRFLSQFKEKLDNGTFDGKNVIDNAIYEIWRGEMLKDAHELCLNEDWKEKVQGWKDGTKVGGFGSTEEMRFVGCMIHNSVPRCFHYNYDQFIAMNAKNLENLMSTTDALLILIVPVNTKQIIDRTRQKVKIIYLVLDDVDANIKVTYKLSALNLKSQDQLKDTELNFMGNKVSALDIFGNELLETLPIWNIYSFYKGVALSPNHFYMDQEITGKRKFFNSATDFARELIKEESNFAVISSDAGMGKSTALKQIAFTLQDELQNYWIVHLNLFNVQNDLSRAKNKLTSKEAAVEIVRNLVLSERKDKEVLTKVFNWKLHDKKMMFLFDSLDEICPFHRETAETFIELLRETKLQIILTTRPHEGKNYDNAEKFKLEPLHSESQRRKFIEQKFKLMGKTPPTNTEEWLENFGLKSYYCNSEFWSLPLNLNMAISIYDTDEDIAEPSNFKRQKNIYEAFINKSIEDTLIKKFNIDKHLAASHSYYIKKTKKFNEVFETLAICVIFHAGEVKKSNTKNFKLLIEENGEDINRFDVAKLDNEYTRVCFLHRSYAEYLVAKVFLKFHKKDAHRLDLTLNNKQLEIICVEDRGSQIRKHICGILGAHPSEEIDFVPHVIKRIKNEFLRNIIEEDCYELYLQLKKHVTFKLEYTKLEKFIQNNFNHPFNLALKKARQEFVRQLIKDGAKFEDILNESFVLHLAVKKNLLQQIQDHFESLKSNINMKNRQGETPLSIAIEGGSIEMVEFLIEKGANLNANSGRETPLYYAIKANSKQIAYLLIAQGAIVAEALKWAAECNRKDLFDLIFNNTPDAFKVERLRKAHFSAVNCGNLEIFEHICGFPEANPSELLNELSGDTILHYAAACNQWKLMPFILKYLDNKVDIRNAVGQTPLMTAILNNNSEVVEWLIDNQADIHAVDNKGYSCLHFAAGYKCLHCYNFLDKSGGYSSLCLSKNLWRVVYHDQCVSNVHVVKYLLQKGADAAVVDNNGNTCLHAACADSYTEARVTVLVDHLPVNCTNHRGETPLHEAAYRGKLFFILFLLKAAKDQNLEPIDGDEIRSLTIQIRDIQEKYFVFYRDSNDDEESDNDEKRCGRAKRRYIEDKISRWQYIVKI